MESMKVFVRLRREGAEPEAVKSPAPALKRVASTLMTAAKSATEKTAATGNTKSPVPSLKRVASSIMAKPTVPVKVPEKISIPADTCVEMVDDKTVKLVKGSGTHITEREYSFDKVFPESASNDDIYASVAENVVDAVKGFNTTIFTYGQMMSGMHNSELCSCF